MILLKKKLVGWVWVWVWVRVWTIIITLYSNFMFARLLSPCVTLCSVVWQDVYDSGRTGLWAGLLLQDYHWGPGRPPQGHLQCLLTGIYIPLRTYWLTFWMYVYSGCLLFLVVQDFLIFSELWTCVYTCGRNNWKYCFHYYYVETYKSVTKCSV